MDKARLLSKIKSSYKNSKKKFIIYSIVSVLIIIVLSIIIRTVFKSNYVVGLNFTPSLHERVFIIDKFTNLDTLVREDLIGFVFQEKDSIYFDKGENFIKYVICMQGDDLVVDSSQIKCNKKYYGSALKIDGKGNVLKQFKYKGKVPKDKYFVWTPYVKSYDSRYWGFVDKKDIIGKAIWKL
ncbi:signal peptidase I [Poseidonibacter ostreae]|uniref:Signal peptidase I n=1 Tax=Poseidonibacter ostreae TaxID=2654171 RepID=A0A6L4WRA4_9BACT|nr:signal peptidase I [Poseidonibacter ostreae]KAB7884672.1 signal peptidase I [Poseidonibacter ostreae]KAB7885181.1 signal peptidase I [Poseidonibacter ostreae]KAB7889591.1 signal peptidase I [Poseidonibacter ostreae]